MVMVKYFIWKWTDWMLQVPIDVPNTTGWQTWETASVQNIALTEGEHDMRIVFDSDYMNLNYIEFKGVVTATNNDLINSEIQVYPNPFSETGIIETSGVFDYQIFNQGGKIIEFGSGENRLHVGRTLPKGFYLLKISKDGNQNFHQLIKQ